MIPNRYSEPYSSLISAFVSNEDANESSDSSSLGWLWPENQLGFKDNQAEASRLDKKRWDYALWNNGEILRLYLDRVDCVVQVNSGDNLKKEMATNISMKLWSKYGKKVSDKSSLSRQ